MSTQSQVQFSEDGQWWWDGAAWRAVQTDPPPAAYNPAPAGGTSPAVAGGISPAVAAVVRPQRFVAANASARNKYIALVDGVPVDGHDVATLAIVLPLVSLWADGVVDYSHTVSKKLMLTFHSLKATVKQDVNPPGISGQLLAGLKRNQDVEGAVRKWLGPDHANPWNHVIGTAVLEGVEAGFYNKVDAHRNFLAAAFKGNFTLEVNGDRVRSADAEVDRLAALFTRHRESDPVLHEQMWKKVHGAIQGNTERTVDNDF